MTSGTAICSIADPCAPVCPRHFGCLSDSRIYWIVRPGGTTATTGRREIAGREWDRGPALASTFLESPAVHITGWFSVGDQLQGYPAPKTLKTNIPSCSLDCDIPMRPRPRHRHPPPPDLIGRRLAQTTPVSFGSCPYGASETRRKQGAGRGLRS